MPAPASLKQTAMVYCYALEYLKQLIYKGFESAKNGVGDTFIPISSNRFLLCNGSDCVIFGLFQMMWGEGVRC